MSSRCLRDLVIWARLHRVDEIRKPDSILDEENWDVVSNDILGTLVVRLASIKRYHKHTKVPFICIAKELVSNEGDG